MKSNPLLALADYALDASSAPASQPAEPPLSKLLATLLAFGVCVLAVWIASLLTDTRRISLSRTPGRPNKVNPAHILAVLLVLLATQLASAETIGRLTGLDHKSYVAVIPSLMAAQLATIVATLAVAAVTFRLGLRRGLGLSLRHWIYDGARSAAAFLIVLPPVMALAVLGERLLPHKTHEMLVMFADPQFGWTWKLLIAVSAIALAPLAEELLFRGLLQSMLRRYLGKPWTAILIASACFAAVHIPSEPQSVFALFALSVGLGYVYERSGRLVSPILTHAIFNAVMLWNAFATA